VSDDLSLFYHRSESGEEDMNELAENGVCGIVVRDKYEPEQWRFTSWAD